jgi:hypothetical protein
MPSFLGVQFVWRAVRNLKIGDELLFDIGERAFIGDIRHDRHGTWLEMTDRLGIVVDSGYAAGRYRVITDPFTGLPR